MAKTEVRGVRVDPQRLKRWDTIAEALGVSRNEAFCLLLDGAEVVSRPQAKVTLVNRNTQTLASERVAVVEA